MNPQVALIGQSSLIMLFGWAYLPAEALRRLLLQIGVVVLRLVRAHFDLTHEHHAQMSGHDFAVGPKPLVSFRPQVERRQARDAVLLKIRPRAALFSNYLTLKRHLNEISSSERNEVRPAPARSSHAFSHVARS